MAIRPRPWSKLEQLPAGLWLVQGFSFWDFRGSSGFRDLGCFVDFRVFGLRSEREKQLEGVSRRMRVEGKASSEVLGEVWEGHPKP